MRIGFRRWKLKINDLFEYEFHPIAMDRGAWKLKGKNRIECDTEETEQSRIVQEGLAILLGKEESKLVKGNSHPNERCPCGFYQFYHIDSVIKELYYGEEGIVGAVMSWGNMTGHGSEGFRSEYAQIVGVIKPGVNSFPPLPMIKPSRELEDNKYMVRYADYSFEEFQEVLNLVGKLGSQLPAAFSNIWVIPTLEKQKKIWENMQKIGGRIKQLEKEWQEEVKGYEERLRTHYEDSLKRFIEQMPFPVFEKSEELVEYAKKFGDLGRKKR